MTGVWRGIAALLICLPAFAEANSFDGVVTHVTDGDTLWVRPASGGAPTPIRIDGIDAPEICQEFGRESREALVAHVLHKPVRVNSRAVDDYHRGIGHVSLGGEDVGVWMVSHGYAWSYRFRRDRGPYSSEEARARKARLGLWHTSGALPPRDFRKSHGSCHAP